MILISLVIAIGIVFHLAKTVLLSSTAWLQEPTQRPEPREHTSAERVPSAVAQHTGQD